MTARKQRVFRDLSTAEGRDFWELPPEVETWPAWRLAGVSVPEPHSSETHRCRTCKRPFGDKP